MPASLLHFLTIGLSESQFLSCEWPLGGISPEQLGNDTGFGWYDSPRFN